MLRGVRSAALLDQMVVSGGNFLYSLVLARILGLHSFGEYSLLWLIVLFINGLQMAAIVMPMFTISGDVPENERRSYYEVVLAHQHIFNALTLAACLVGWLVAQSFSDASLSDAALIAGLAITFHAQEFYRRYFYCENQASKALAADVLAYGLRFIPLLMWQLLGWKVSSADALLFMIGAYLASWLLGRELSEGLRWPSRVALRTHSPKQWGLARFLLPSAVMQWLSVNFHLSIASVILGYRAVGVIRLGQTLVNTGNIYLQAMENVLPLRVSTAQRDRGTRAAIDEALRSMLKACGIIGIGAAAISLFAPELMSLLFGRQYKAYAFIIYWFGAIYLFAFVQTYARVLLRALDAAEFWFRAYVLATVVSLISFYPLQTQLGINGVLLGMLLAYVALIGYAAHAIRRQMAALA